jgi:hypothetical protein
MGEEVATWREEMDGNRRKYVNECDRNDDARKRREMRCVYDAIEKGKVVDAGPER